MTLKDLLPHWFVVHLYRISHHIDTISDSCDLASITAFKKDKMARILFTILNQ